MADETFAELVRETSPRLYRLAYRMTGSGADAEDVMQETYLRAHLMLAEGQFEGRAALATWLYRVALNLALDALRRRKRRVKFLAIFRLFPVEAPERTEAHAALAEAGSLLSSLPPEQAGAVILTQIEGLSNAEAAAALGCTEGAIEQRLIRARAAMRRVGKP